MMTKNQQHKGLVLGIITKKEIESNMINMSTHNDCHSTQTRKTGLKFESKIRWNKMSYFWFSANKDSTTMTLSSILWYFVLIILPCILFITRSNRINKWRCLYSNCYSIDDFNNLVMFHNFSLTIIFGQWSKSNQSTSNDQQKVFLLPWEPNNTIVKGY